jgi:hypothetical protein
MHKEVNVPIPDRDYFALHFRTTKKCNDTCSEHTWTKTFEGVRAKQYLGFITIPSLTATHCDGRHMVWAEVVVIQSCYCGGEQVAVYGARGYLCLICNHSESTDPVADGA